MAVTCSACEDSHVQEPWKLIDIHRRVGSSNIQVPWFVGHAGKRVHQLRSRARERQWKRSAEIVNARERWEGEHSSLTRSHSHRTAHFLSASRRRKKTVRRRRKEIAGLGRQTSIVLTAVQQSCVLWKGVKESANWITGVRTQAQRGREEKKKGMKENCGQLLIHSTVWHGVEKTAQSNRTISFLFWFPALVSSFCLSHVWYLFFRPRGGR